MNGVQYGGAAKIRVDTCPERGLWFDQDELRRVVATPYQMGLGRNGVGGVDG